MKTHKAETVAIARKITGFSQDVEEPRIRPADAAILVDGKFDPKGLAKLAQPRSRISRSWPSPPDMAKLYTEAYLPKL